jgi:hypothetical protein
MNDFVAFRCPHCHGNLEFDAGQAGETIACPHCDDEILLSHPLSAEAPPEGAPPKSLPVAEPVWFGSEASVVEIVLTSGTALKIKEVRLYDAKELHDLAAQKKQAAELLNEVSSPYGAMGDPLWVVSATKSIGLMEERKSRETAQAALALIQKLVEQERKLREEVNFFPVGRVQDMQKPVPSLWQVPSAESKYVHNGDEFVTVKDTGGAVKFVRWSCVESYGYQANK